MCVWPKHSASPVEVPRRWLLTSLMVLAFAWQFPSSTESSKQRGHHLYCGLYYLWLSLEEQTVQCLMTEDMSHHWWYGSRMMWRAAVQIVALLILRNEEHSNQRQALPARFGSLFHDLKQQEWTQCEKLVKGLPGLSRVLKACLCLGNCLPSRRSSRSSQNSSTQWGDSNCLKSCIGY